jgi:DNA-binding transcriptional regulator YbjK
MQVSDRRTRIADAALELLGKQGARALTHRAIDQAIGLPAGSTSYYCSRRSDLLALVVKRFTDLEHQEAVEYAAALHGPMSLDEIAGVLAGQIWKWVKARHVLPLATRFELFLAAGREPSLQRLVRNQRRKFLATIETALLRAGAADPRSTAKALLALIEGLLLDTLRSGRPVLRRWELTKVLRALIRVSQPRSVRSRAIA